MDEFGIWISTEKFEEGDIICHINNWNKGFYLFFKATDSDVESYSGHNGIYIKIIQS